MTNRYLTIVLALLCFNLSNAQRKKNKTNAPQFKETLYDGMEWRMVGPHRGGRAGTVTGVINDPNLYYMGTAGGGVWKTTDAGNSW